MSTGGRVAKVRRIQDLFTEGKTIEIVADDGPIYLFVAKPSSFDRDEASKDGRAERAKRVLLFDRDEDEQAVVEEKLGSLTTEEIVRTLVGAKGNDFYMRAVDDIRAEKDWAERLEVLERSELGGERSEAEEKLLIEINLSYLTEVQERSAKMGEEYAEELRAMDVPKLHEEYRKTWRENLGTAAYLQARRYTEIYLALRDCDARPDDTKPDGYDHSRCNGHVTRLLDHRNEVLTLPDGILVRARQALDELEMPPRDAAFSDAPTSSSASSEQPSEEEDSTASTQDETSPEQVGI